MRGGAACSVGSGLQLLSRYCDPFCLFVCDAKQQRNQEKSHKYESHVLFVVDLGGSPTVLIYRVGSLVPDCDSSSPIGYFMMAYKHWLELNTYHSSSCSDSTPIFPPLASCRHCLAMAAVAFEPQMGLRHPERLISMA